MKIEKLSIAAFWAAIGLMGLLMAVRLYLIISFAEPLQIITSGDEQASLFSVWKAVNDQAVYTDPTRSPYTMSFFNGLFYYSYGLWTSFWLATLSLSDSWLPTVSRFFSLLGVAAAWLSLTRLLQISGARVCGNTDIISRLMPPACASVLCIGPLMGFWAFTVRPDLWALVFEIIAVLAFVRLYAEKNLTAVLLAVVFLLLGWSFKQASIGVIAGIGLFLLFERQWRLLAIYTVLFIAVWTTIIYLGGELYRHSIFFTQIQLEYSLSHSARVWSNGLSKSLPIVGPLAVVFVVLVKNQTFRTFFLGNWICRFFLINLGTSSLIIFLMTIQNGSAENYLFTPLFLASGLLVCGHAASRSQLSGMSSFNAVLLTTTGVQALLCCLVLAGVIGVLDGTKTHRQWVDTARCINQLPKPIFTEGTYLSLPWMTESAEPFVLSYTYSRARKSGIPHEKDGIGGRINNGEFATLAISRNSPNGGYDGADLLNYTLQPTKCGALSIWSRARP
ncbi:MAG: hypothetical protein WD075_08805 [Rhodospirillales bacterium]